MHYLLFIFSVRVSSDKIIKLCNVYVKCMSIVYQPDLSNLNIQSLIVTAVNSLEISIHKGLIALDQSSGFSREIYYALLYHCLRTLSSFSQTHGDIVDIN